MNRTYPPLPLLAIFVVCFINARTMYASWFHSPLEKLSWLALLIWSTPIWFYWWKQREPNESFDGNTIAASFAIGLTLLSIIGSINIFAYIALALSGAALVPLSQKHILWIISSISWMPALSWGYAHVFPNHTIFPLELIRIILSTLGASWIIYTQKVKQYE